MQNINNNKSYLVIGVVIVILIALWLGGLFDDKKKNENNKEHFTLDNANVPSNVVLSSDNETNNSKNSWYVTQDTAPEGTYKQHSYANGNRGSSDINPELDSLLQMSNDLTQKEYMTSDNFVGYDKNDGMFAQHVKSPNDDKKGKEKIAEMFNADNFLPQGNNNNDWFEVMPDAISVKNRHLINTSKPISVDTVSSSLRNASYDIRGSPANPKFAVSLWQNSTIEPDTNLKSLC